MASAASPQSSPTPLTRRERRKAEVRGRILEAAVVLFEQEGFGATRVAEICERADVAHKTFFNHFSTKQHLLREIALAALDQLLADLEGLRKRPAPTRERLAWFFERIAEDASSRGPMQRELLTEFIHVIHESDTEAEQARRLHAAFASIIEDGLALGDVDSTHAPETLTETIMGAFYALMFSWAHLDDYPLRERATAAGRFLGDAICTPPAAARDSHRKVARRRR